MNVVTSAAAMSQIATEARSSGKKIAFVPTMGALHDGHLALMREAGKHGDVVVVSIFVNPKQFNDPKDFEKYTRDLESDLKKCEGAGVDAVFTPPVGEMYPEHDSSPEVPLPDVAKPLEGKFRPGHFEGVVAVVSRLLRIVQPDVAVFGMKDYQQVRVIEEMVAAANFPIRIVRYQTVREADGLAMSSRNVRLSSQGRQTASFLSKTLKAAEYLFQKGERNPAVIATKIEEALAKEKIKIDYIAVVDAVTLEVPASLERPSLVAIAAFVEGVRLIDNCILSVA